MFYLIDKHFKIFSLHSQKINDILIKTKLLDNIYLI